MQVHYHNWAAQDATQRVCNTPGGTITVEVKNVTCPACRELVLIVWPRYVWPAERRVSDT